MDIISFLAYGAAICFLGFIVFGVFALLLDLSTTKAVLDTYKKKK